MTQTTAPEQNGTTTSLAEAGNAKKAKIGSNFLEHLQTLNQIRFGVITNEKSNNITFSR